MALGFRLEVESVVLGLAALLTLASARYIYDRIKAASTDNKDFSRFQRRYLTAFLAVMLADALQGPYLYRVLHAYGLIQSQIAALYIASFLSAMMFGPLLGGFSDTYGRKQIALVFCVTNMCSCVLLWSSNFYVLMLSRLLYGLSMSMLFSTFESWMIAQHTAIGFPSDWIARTMSLTTFGNGTVAVIAGFIANTIVDYNDHHPFYPFVLATMVLMVSFLIIRLTWSETKSDQPARTDRCNGSLRPLVTRSAIWKLGLVQSLFESCTYAFTFLWTPALDINNISNNNNNQQQQHAPLGFIYGAFMLAVMTGSFAFRRMVEANFAISTIMTYSLIFSAASLALSTYFDDFHSLFLCFVLFQVGCGAYFPSMATMRSRILPDQHRGALMGWFRVPLNVIVIVFLLVASTHSVHFMLVLCTFLTVVALVMTKSLTASLELEALAASLG